MDLRIQTLVVGFEDGVEGVCVIANKGMPTEQRWSIPMWTALNCGLELSRRGAILISDSHGGVPQATTEQVKVLNS
jgi:hypothetical protein